MGAPVVGMHGDARRLRPPLEAPVRRRQRHPCAARWTVARARCGRGQRRRGLDRIHWLIFEEEYFRAKAPSRVNQNGIFLLGPTLMEYGTPEQKVKYLEPYVRGEIHGAGGGEIQG